MAEMAKMLRRGVSRVEIARKMGVPISRINYDWKFVLKQLRDSRSEDSKAMVEATLEQYAEVKKEAWEAWELAKEGFRRTVTEETPVPAPKQPKGGEGAKGKPGRPSLAERLGEPVHFGNRSPEAMADKLRRTKVTVTQENRSPPAEFLRIILQVLEAERELLALNPPKELSVKGTVTAWDMLAQGVPQGEVTDDIEEAIKKALGYNPGVPPVATTGPDDPHRVNGTDHTAPVVLPQGPPPPDVVYVEAERKIREEVEWEG